MNKKLLALAVASTFAIPGVVAADASFYGAVKPRVNVQDSDLSMTDGGSCARHFPPGPDLNALYPPFFWSISNRAFEDARPSSDVSRIPQCA